MAEATMQGVSLLTKARRRPADLFELAVTYDGIEIRRPGESARHLSWDRVSEWEIEQRRDGVLLTLRGGGSVTPLVIPRWSVDELDVVLRQVTSQPPTDGQPVAPQATKAPSAPPAIKPPVVTPPVTPKAAITPAPGAAPVPSEPTNTPTSRPNPTAATPAPPPVLTPPTPKAKAASIPEAQATPTASAAAAAAATLAAAVPAVAIPVELAQALDLEPEPPLEATFEDVVSQHLAPRRPAPARPAEPDTPHLTSALVWPQESTLEPVTERPSLSWPGGAGATDVTPPTHEFRLPAAPPGTSGTMDGAMAPITAGLTFTDDLAVADLVTEDAVDALLGSTTAPVPTAPAIREPALPTPPPIVIAPREGAPDVVQAPTRADRRRTERRARVRPEPAPREPVPKKLPAPNRSATRPGAYRSRCVRHAPAPPWCAPSQPSSC